MALDHKQTLRAVIVGASSGIGEALAEKLAPDCEVLVLTARRLERLQTIANRLGTNVQARAMDLQQTQACVETLSHIIQEHNGVDLVVLCAGTGELNPALEWSLEAPTIAVNVTGCAALAGVSMRHFAQKDQGHLVGISSIAALRGSGRAPAYNASKAFLSSYLEGMRQWARQRGCKNIVVTDIQPGFVDTAMAKGEGLFWVAPARVAAQQIYRDIQRKRRRAYVTRRWRLLAWVFQLIPGFLYERM